MRSDYSPRLQEPSRPEACSQLHLVRKSIEADKVYAECFWLGGKFSIDPENISVGGSPGSVLIIYVWANACFTF